MENDQIEKIRIQNYNPRSLLYLWDEIEVIDFTKMKFSCFGAGTVPVPEFHVKNYQEVTNGANVADYQYPSIKGLDVLAESISRNFRNIYGREIDPKENVLICDGANRTISAILDSHTADGDEVLVFEPFYNCHIVDLNQDKDITVRLCQFDIIENEDGGFKQFRFNVENFKKAMNDKVKVVMIINPNNPTGYTFSSNDLKEISDVLNNYPNAVVIEDNAYFAYIVPQTTEFTLLSSIGNNHEKTYNVFSAGKFFNAHGVRVGWTISSKKLIDQAYNARHKGFNFVSIVEQQVVAKDLDAFSKPFNGFNSYIEYLVDQNHNNIEYIGNILTKYDIIPIPSMGTYYLNADMSRVIPKIPEKYYYNLRTGVKSEEPDQALCRWLLSEFSVGFLPFSTLTFNTSNFKTLIRLATNRTKADFDYVDECLGKILS